MARDWVILMKSGMLLTVPGVVAITYEDKVVHDGSTHRDLLGSAELGRAVLGVDVAMVAAGTATASLLDMPNPNTKGIRDVGNTIVTTEIADAKFAKDDRVNHEPPRPSPMTIGLWRLWDGIMFTVPGAGITNGSRTVTLPSTASLSAGMQVVGVGIPTGAVILTVDDATTLTLTQPATATDTVDLNFTPGNMIGFWKEGEQECAGSHPSVPGTLASVRWV